jgi:hypothetical protein
MIGAQVAVSPDDSRGGIVSARRISQGLKPSRRWQRMLLRPERAADGAEIWANNVYSATLRRFSQGWMLGGGPWAQIGVWCEDGEARHDWRDFQRLKNDLVGPMWEAVELYPREERLMDPSNYYLLFCAPEIPVGIYKGRVFANTRNCIAPQRAWSGDEPREAAL